MPRWDSASKDKQRLLIQQQRPWLQATGPVTLYGRRVSSRNALKKKKPLSQQLRSAFTPPCENAAEMSPDVTFMSLQTNEGDTDRPLEIGDRVTYIGGYQQTMLACGHEPMLVAGFCQLGTGAIACRTAGGKLIWIYPQDLERCLDGQRKHESGNQS